MDVKATRLHFFHCLLQITTTRTPVYIQFFFFLTMHVMINYWILIDEVFSGTFFFFFGRSGTCFNQLAACTHVYFIQVRDFVDLKKQDKDQIYYIIIYDKKNHDQYFIIPTSLYR